jgi:serine/threonine protein kinase
MDTKIPLLTIYGKRSSYSFYPVVDKMNRMEGGMGRVFKGKDNNSGMPVAIKVIYSELASKPTIKNRAELEGHLQFKHDNLIEMLDFCVSKEGKVHVVSTFVSGLLIVDFLKSNKMSVPEKQQFVLLKMQSILDALDFIHKKNIIHRDIKPENIKINDKHNAVLMDLGVAKATNGKTLTYAGVVIGTPYYSAPEQIRGEGQKINATTDIYALGITIYELLTDTLPFTGTSQFDVMEKQVKKPLPDHSMLSAKIFGVLKKATEKEQYKRYQTALEFKAAIQNLIAGRSAWQRISSFINQRIK